MLFQGLNYIFHECAKSGVVRTINEKFCEIHKHCLYVLFSFLLKRKNINWIIVSKLILILRLFLNRLCTSEIFFV